jgi:CubicO group peptidase (beta-lactamase class C family)
VTVDPRQIDALFSDRADPDLPGYAVGVMQDGQIVHAKGYGMADLEHGAKIMPDTVFHVASLSKQFTAWAVLMLEDAGKLSLGDHVTRYVTGMPACAKRITLRHLLYHTSGLRDQWPLLRLAGWRDMDERTEEDVLDLVRGQTRLNFDPGANFTYCNTGYTLLAHVVSQVSGESLREFTTKRIFKPLRMTSTRFRDDHTELEAGRAYGYTGSGPGEFGLWVPNFDLVGPTSLHTTVDDLLLWAGNQLSPRGAFGRIVKAQRQPGKLNRGRRVGYGAGVGLGVHRGLALVRHSGWDLGYVSHLAVYPKEGCAVAILGNLATLNPALKARQVAELCLDGRFPDPRPPLGNLTERQLKGRVGVYRHPRTGRAVRLLLADDGLLLSYASPPRSSSALAPGLGLHPLNATRFLGSDETTEVQFTGSRLTVRDEFGVKESFERAGASNPEPRELKALAGTYRSAELGTTLTVSMGTDKGLVVTQHRGPDRPLSPAYQNAFTDDNKTTYIFTPKSAREAGRLMLSSERVQNLRFDLVR